MAVNQIVGRVAEFLHHYPPFNFLDAADVETIAARVHVRFCPQGEIIFAQGTAGTDFVYMLNSGTVTLWRNHLVEDNHLVDKCDEGDLFGVRSFLSGNAYVLTARCEEDSLVYEIPRDVMRHYAETEPGVSYYFAAGLASDQAGFSSDPKRIHPSNLASSSGSSAIGATSAGSPIGIAGGGVAPSLAVGQVIRKTLTCRPTDDIRSVAALMGRQSAGSALVTGEKGYPVGIVTDTDLRNKVVAVGLDTSRPVADIMSAPVVTVAATIDWTEASILMLKKRLHHLVVTTDGGAESEVTGIISSHDLLMAQGHTPAGLISEVRHSDDPAVWAAVRGQAEQLLRDYLAKELSVALVCTIITEINDAIIEKAVALAIAQTRSETGFEPQVGMVWLNMGSEGREEQLLRTDLDNAILFDDGPDNEGHKKFFLQVAHKVIGILNDCGFSKCPADMMASNPEWCRPFREWADIFRKWVVTPDPMNVMHTTIFFDFRPICGDIQLAGRLTETVRALITENRLFVHHLAEKAAAGNPPLSFFRNFVVEKSGEHKDEFDIKARAMMPLTDVARLLYLDLQSDQKKVPAGITNTVKRFEALALLKPESAGLFKEAAAAYEFLLRCRAASGLRSDDSGRYVSVQDLTKMDRQILRNSFEPVRELQQLIKVKYQLNIF